MFLLFATLERVTTSVKNYLNYYNKSHSNAGSVIREKDLFTDPGGIAGEELPVEL